MLNPNGTKDIPYLSDALYSTEAMRGRALAALGRAAEAEAAFDESAAVARRHGLRLLELLALRDLQRCVLQVRQQPDNVSLTAARRSPAYSVMATTPCRRAGAAAGATPPPAALLVALPTADVLESYDPKRNLMTRFGGAKTACVLAAEVCLKLGHPEAALPYLAKALRHDVAPSQRDDRPTARAHAEVRKALGFL